MQLVAAIADLAIVMAAPWNTLVDRHALPDSLVSRCSRAHTNLAGTLILVGSNWLLWLFVRRASPCSAALAAARSACCRELVGRSTNEIEAQVRGTPARKSGTPANWIDHATSIRSPTSTTARSYWNAVWQELFWNPQINRCSLWPIIVPGPMTQTQSDRFRNRAASRTKDHYIVAAREAAVFGDAGLADPHRRPASMSRGSLSGDSTEPARLVDS